MYRGVVKTLLVTNSEQAFSVRCGDRIAHLIYENIVLPEVLEVQEVSQTMRGPGVLVLPTYLNSVATRSR